MGEAPAGAGYVMPSVEHEPFVRSDDYGERGLQKQNVLERARLFVARVTIMPLRFCVSVSLVICFYLVCLAFPKDSVVNRVAFSVLSRTILFVIGFYYIKVERYGEMKAEKSGGVVSNHVGWTDILILAWLFSPSFVSREATRNTPIVGKISVCLDNIFVDRDKGGGGLANKLQDRMKQTHEQKSRPVAIFAEGTTTNGKYVLPFRSGAFLAGVPVTLVIIEYKSGRVSPAWESIGGVRHIVLMLSEVQHNATVKIINFTPKKGESPQEAAERARQMMINHSALAPSSSTFKDKLQYHKMLLEQGDHNKKL